MIEPHIVKNKPSPPAGTKGIVDPMLPGTWRFVQTGRLYVIDTDSFYYVVGDATPYTVTATTLDLDGWVFNRLYGSGPGLPGVWQEPSTSEELHLRSAGTMTWHDPQSVDLFGRYELAANPDRMTLIEARCYLIEDSGRLQFDVFYGGAFTYDFTVDQNNLVLTDTTSGDVLTYERVV